jgi:hypothetical protein
MADLPDVVWSIGLIRRKVRAKNGDIGYVMQASCMKRGFCA